MLTMVVQDVKAQWGTHIHPSGLKTSAHSARGVRVISMGPTASGTNLSVAQRWTDASAKIVQGLVALRGRYPNWPVCRIAAVSDRDAHSARVDAF
jgi:hypothetical protein